MKRAAGLLAATTMVLTACGGTADEPGGGLGEAIGVQGAWTIEVRNPDGSLDDRVSFDNAFTGAAILSRVLALTNDIVGWRVGLIGTEDLCNDGTPACYLSSVGSDPLLEVSLDSTANETVLRGSTTVDVSGAFQAVEAFLDQGPVDWDFSNHVFSENGEPDVVVEAGQVVQVEVRYSFG